ncbi:MAG: right-handed parallel beta-helix repeat-containing protein, partial [Deltaproteobacteria bacterium]|nr:right-handed parallel beta-helix repeat-containing protein [Deltaproteobacteria bacterium]
QTVDLAAAGFSDAELDSLDLELVFGGRIRAASETSVDRGRLEVSFLRGDGTEISSLTTSSTNPTDRWDLVGDRVPIPVGTRQVVLRFEATRASGTANNSYLDGAFLYVVSENIAPDLGAYGNTAEDAPATAPHVALRFPDLYTDWELDEPLTILWDSYGNTEDSQVRIDLYQDSPRGPALFGTIDWAAPDTGEYTWIPSSLAGVDYGTHGLRIQVSLKEDPGVLDRGTEPFSVPEDGNTYYVDDGSDTGDQYTPGAAGSNRNTGKTADAPKPDPVNLLRAYDLSGGGAVLNIDAGDYFLLYPVTLTGSAELGSETGLGQDEGFTMQGPDTGPGVLFRMAMPGYRPEALVELNNADLMSVRNLALEYAQRGLWVHGGSDQFSADHITAHDHTLDGIRIETQSPLSVYDHFTAYDAGDSGIRIEGRIGGLTHAFSHDNADYGIYLKDPGNAQVSGGVVYGNRDGIYVDNNVSGTTTVVGGAPGGLEGNLVHSNTRYGIEARSNVLVYGNTVYGRYGDGDVGIYLGTGTARALQNVVYGAQTGIDAHGGTVEENRVFGNVTGVYVGGGGVNVWHNVIYSNTTGVHAGAYAANSEILGNIFYDNSAHAVRINYGSGHDVVNNTIYGATGNGISLEGNVSNNTIRNNIIWTEAGYGISVGTSAQVGFQSDYNLFYTQGSGSVGFWQGVARTGLTDWRSASFTDGQSFYGDPLFVDPDGLDDLLGYGLDALSSALIVDDGDPGFVSTGPWTVRDTRGFSSDDRFTEKGSGESTASWTFTGLTPGYYQVAVSWEAGDSSSYASNARFTVLEGDEIRAEAAVNQRYEQYGPNDFEDSGAWWEILGVVRVTGDTLVVELTNEADGRVIADAVRIQQVRGDAGSDDDFHLQSLHQSFHGGSLAPVLDFGTGLPTPAEGAWTVDAAQSPAIDRGDATDSFDLEPDPDGGYINLGAYGNTVQASRSPSQYVLVIRPNEGVGIPHESTYEIQWRSFGFGGLVDIEYSSNGGSTYSSLSAGEANDGSYEWYVDPGVFPASDSYVLRISSVDQPSVLDDSDVFQVTPPIHIYYVNDDVVEAGDWTTAIGSDANTGLSPSAPKASIRAMLEAYDLGENDFIYVDAGTYELTANIQVTADDAGVTILGYNDPLYPDRKAILDRGNTASGSYTVQLLDADGVRLSHLHITGGRYGVYASSSSDSDGVVIEESEVYGNSEYGV